MHFVEFQGLPSKPIRREDKTILLIVTDASFIVLFQAETEELSGTEEHKNAKKTLETTVLEDQDFDRSVKRCKSVSNICQRHSHEITEVNI